MALYWVFTTMKTGEGKAVQFCFDCPDFETVADLAGALDDGEMVVGERLEQRRNAAGEFDEVGRRTIAIGRELVGIVQEYKTIGEPRGQRF